MNKPDLKWINYLTTVRVLNALAVHVSYLISSLLHKNIHFGFPVSISTEPSAFCNLRCPECPAGSGNLQRERGFMEMGLFKSFIDQISKRTIYLTLYFQGEPYLQRQLFDMIDYAKSKNLYTATSTNGHFLDIENTRKTVESGLDRIIISVDGTTQEVYEKYRIGGRLEKVLQGTKNLLNERKKMNSKKPEIVFQFLVTAWNEHQISEMKTLARKTGVDKLEFKTAQIYDFENGHEMIPRDQKYSRYGKAKDGRFYLKSKLPRRCLRLWSSAVITHDGYVLPCCFDKDGKYSAGDLKKNSFREIWQGEEVNRFRKMVLTSRKNIDICRNCTEGMS